MRRAFGDRRLITIAAGAEEKFLADAQSRGQWLAELAPSLDWINLMSYDYHGSWERIAGFNAGLDDVEASVARLVAAGIPERKITLGVPFYGKGWWGCAPGPRGDGLGQPCQGLAQGSEQETFDYAYLADRGYLVDPGYAHLRSATAHVPYLYEASSGIFITYDDERSIAEKMALVERLGLRGAMFWELDADRHGVLRGVVARSLRH
jgi:chitinase